MSETRTDNPPTQSQDAAAAAEAHGRHRGTAARDDATAEPHGKHRKPAAE
ncbi:hypothetical protein [Streptomyces qinzhouensis]|nr:hypothetical protein [Streptomyces qinzhouensis]